MRVEEYVAISTPVSNEFAVSVGHAEYMKEHADKTSRIMKSILSDECKEGCYQGKWAHLVFSRVAC